MREVIDQQHLQVACEQPFGVHVDSLNLTFCCVTKKMGEVSDQQHLSFTYERPFGVLLVSIEENGFLRRTAPLIFNMRVPGTPCACLEGRYLRLTPDALATYGTVVKQSEGIFGLF